MARYEGMEEIIQRLRARAGQRRSSAAPAQFSSSMSEKPPANLAFGRATEQVVALLRAAEDLHVLLMTERMHGFAPPEQDNLMAMLGKVVRELEGCESALQRVAPYD